MQQQDRTVERRLAWLATRAHGVVTRKQLVGAGISAEQTRQRLRSGGLIVEYRGVYRVKGIDTTRARRARRETTVWRGVPITTPARTLVDLAAVLDEAELARACHEAGVRHDTTPCQVEAVLSRRPNVAGARKLRAILRGDVRVTLSRLESRFLQRLSEAALPPPQTNRVVGGRRVDCHWPDQQLTVELDGYRFHHSRHAWEQDRRYTYNDVLETHSSCWPNCEP